MKYFHDINEKCYQFLDKYKNDLSFLGNTELDVDIDEYIKGYINPITKKKIDDNCDKYYISNNVTEIANAMNYSKKMKMMMNKMKTIIIIIMIIK